jgi:hypothetical protein
MEYFLHLFGLCGDGHFDILDFYPIIIELNNYFLTIKTKIYESISNF